MTRPLMYCVPEFGATARQGMELRVASPLQSTGGSVTCLEWYSKAGVGVAAGAAGVGVACSWPLLDSRPVAPAGTRPSALAMSPPFTTETSPGLMPAAGLAVF